jgi:mono/diheme cytochrome c family protein
MSRRFIILAAAILLAVPVAILSGQETSTSALNEAPVKKVPAPYTRASSGKDMYVAYCASCHGKDGKGNGPAASALKSVPTDLTQLAASNGGRFPENHVSQTIKGDFATPSHGSKDMPVWGSIFASMGTSSDGSMQLRIRNLTKYIASLQQ